MSRTPTRKKKEAAPRGPRDLKPGKQSRIEFLEAALAQLVKDQAAARSAGSWVAVRQLGQDISAGQKELLTLREAPALKVHSPEELVAELLALIRDGVEGFPDPDVEAILVACCERLGLPVGTAIP